MVKKKFLGIDKCGKPWYFYQERHEGNICFYVVQRKKQYRNIPWKDQYVVQAMVHRISKNRAIIEDFVHTNSEGRSNNNTNLSNIIRNDTFDQMSIQKPAREVGLPDKGLHQSLSEVMNGLRRENSKDSQNYENRGIGKLLLARIEKWARRARIRTLYGFISKFDNVEKLRKMYSNWGWRVRVFDKPNRKMGSHTGYSAGVVIKNLSSRRDLSGL